MQKSSPTFSSLLLTRLALIFILIIFTWFITFGSWELIKEERYGSAYDSLGKSLLRGNCDVEHHSIGGETYGEDFLVNGKYYMYFGPWPSIIRIFLNSLFPLLYGNWSRLSCLIAAILCLVSFTLIVRQQLIKNSSLSENQRDLLLLFSLLGFGLGSPVLFLMSIGYIYHESILWGLCWTIFGMYFIFNLISNTNKHSFMLVGLSCSAGLALLSRVTSAVPLYLILIPISISIWVQPFKDRISPTLYGMLNLFEFHSQPKKINAYFLKTFILISPAIIALAFQLWYNQCRFSSVTSFAEYKYYYAYRTWWSQSDKEKVDAVGTINIKRIPTAALCYFGLRPEYFSNKAPFFKMLWNQRYDTSLYTGFSEWNISLAIVSLWLVWGGTIGFLWLCGMKNNLLIKLCTFAFFIQLILILSYLGITHRYTADLSTFFIFLYSFYLSQIGKKRYFKNVKNVILLTSVLCIFSIASNILSTLDWISSFDHDASEVFKQSIRNSFQYFNTILDRIGFF